MVRFWRILFLAPVLMAAQAPNRHLAFDCPGQQGQVLRERVHEMDRELRKLLGYTTNTDEVNRLLQRLHRDTATYAAINGIPDILEPISQPDDPEAAVRRLILGNQVDPRLRPEFDVEIESGVFVRKLDRRQVDTTSTTNHPRSLKQAMFALDYTGRWYISDHYQQVTAEGLTEGMPVVASGEIQIKNGYIQRITDVGPYDTGPLNLLYALIVAKRQGLRMDRVVLQLRGRELLLPDSP